MNTINTSDTEKKKRTITLTRHAPVTIVDELWPIIAQAKWWNGEFEVQADRSWWMKVRRHADGRTIVYGGYRTKWQGDHDRKAGELLDDERSTIATIHCVADDLGAPESLVRELIADLPAVEI